MGKNISKCGYSLNEIVDVDVGLELLKKHGKCCLDCIHPDIRKKVLSIFRKGSPDVDL